MMFYLIAEDIHVMMRWNQVLSGLHPVSLRDIPDVVEPDSIVFVLDKNVKEGAAAEKLFKNRVMVLSMTPGFAEAQKFLQLGAMGYGNAMMHEYHLHSAYQALEEGKVWLHPDFIGLMISQIRENTETKEQSLSRLESLSKREQEVALMLGNGATHQEIADSLDITVRTVKAHATSIYQKLDVKDRLALSLLLHS